MTGETTQLMNTGLEGARCRYWAYKDAEDNHSFDALPGYELTYCNMEGKIYAIVVQYGRAFALTLPDTPDVGSNNPTIRFGKKLHPIDLLEIYV